MPGVSSKHFMFAAGFDLGGRTLDTGHAGNTFEWAGDPSAALLTDDKIVQGGRWSAGLGKVKRPERVAVGGKAREDCAAGCRAHAAALYAGSRDVELWRYLFNGPYTNEAEFREWLEGREKSEDPLFFTILDAASGAPAGYCSLMRIEPAHRVIEVGNILYLPCLQRTVGATEAMYLLARYVFEELGYRRYEWKCDALNAPSRRAALRLGFHVRGNLPAAYDREGKESGHGLVLDVGYGVAGAEAGL